MSTVQIKEVRFKDGFPVPKGIRPEEVREELKALYTKHEGELTATLLFDEVQALPKSAMLRKFFCWDIQEGWRQHNYEQARKLLRSVEIKFVTHEKKTIWIRDSLVLNKVGPNNQVAKSYRPIESVLTKEDLRKQALAQALKEFKSWKERWQTMKELNEIFEAGARIVERLG